MDYTVKAKDLRVGDKVCLEWDYCREADFPVKSIEKVKGGYKIAFSPVRVTYQNRRVSYPTDTYPANHAFPKAFEV